MKDTIKKLAEAYGPSGYEQYIRQLIREEIRGHADEIRTDPLGSLIALKRGNGKGKKVMLAANMDEIGVMVTHIDEKGFCRFAPIGGLNPLTLLGGRVVFGHGVQGVIGMERKHVEAGKTPALNQFFIDVGASDQKTCPVKVGDAAGFVRPFEDLGDRLVAKTMDDRIGCAIWSRRCGRCAASPHEVYFVFTVRRKRRWRVAHLLRLRPQSDVALAVDVTGTGDTPEAN
jgi:endoglucanase